MSKSLPKNTKAKQTAQVFILRADANAEDWDVLRVPFLQFQSTVPVRGGHPPLSHPPRGPCATDGCQHPLRPGSRARWDQISLSLPSLKRRSHGDEPVPLPGGSTLWQERAVQGGPEGPNFKRLPSKHTGWGPQPVMHRPTNQMTSRRYTF
jgi:hypothetical protein